MAGRGNPDLASQGHHRFSFAISAVWRALRIEKGVLRCGGVGVDCDEATTVPVDHEVVPGQAECEDMMAAPVERELVFRARAQSDVSMRAPANHGLAGFFDTGLTFLAFRASGRCGAFRACTSLSAIIGSEGRAAVQLKRSTYGSVVVSLRQNVRGLVQQECKHCGDC